MLINKRNRLIVASAFIVATAASAVAYAAYDYPTTPGTSVTGVKIDKIWIERDPDYHNNTGSEARLFIRFDTRVCGTPSTEATNSFLAGLDIRTGTFAAAEAMQDIATAAKLSDRTVNVRTNNGNSTVGCHLSRLTLD